MVVIKHLSCELSGRDDDQPGAHRRSCLRRAAIISVVALASAFSAIGVRPTAVQAAEPFVPIAAVPLGLVQTFGILSPAAVGNAAPEPATVIRGDVGAGGALTGFPPGVITGTVYADAAVNPMIADLHVAYDSAAAAPAGTPLAADLGGVTAGPGVHTITAATGTAAGGVFTIDGEGHADAVFIFQVGGALALGANTTMALINGAQAKNVFWQVVGAGAIGANTKFVGTLIAGTAVSSGAGSTINGRLTSLTGAVTMSSTQLYSSPPTVSINGGNAALTTDPTPLIIGVTSSRSPATVSLSIDGVAQSPSPAPSPSGVWSFQAPALINGDHTIIASVVDGANNTGSFTQVLTVDTTPPAVSIDGGTIVTINDLTPTVTGTSDVAAGQVVTLTLIRDAPAITLTRTTVVQADQTWNVSPNGMTAGRWTIVARVLDPAGNANTATQILVIDATAPMAAMTSNPLTNDPTPTITGVAEAGATIAVSIDGLAVAGIAAAGTNWSATTSVALSHGNHNVTVTASDAVGNTTILAQTLTVDLDLPAVTINPGATDSVNDRTPTIVGTTDVAVGAIVTVRIDGGVPLNALVQADGWNVTPSAVLSLGEHTIIATVADPAGNVGTATQILTVDTAEPTVVIDGGSSRTTADATPTITGSSPDVPVGSTVTVEVAGQTLTTTIGVGGTYSATATTITPNGTYFVFVTVTDTAGNNGDTNQSLTINAIPPTVTFTNGPTWTTNDATPLIAGATTAPVDSMVTVDIAGQTLHATVQPGGSWNVTAANIDNGLQSVITVITDADGNVGTATQALTIDSGALTAITFNGGASAATNDNTPTISGFTDAADGRIITVTIAGQSLTASAAAGIWAVTAAHINDGTHTATASTTAVGGNPGSATQILTVDTLAPVVVIGDGSETVQTTDPTPTIAGSGATPGSSVTVVVAGQTMTTIVAADGTWSVTPPNPLPTGNNLVTVTITDPAGNTGTDTQTISVVAEPTTVTFSGGATVASNDDTPTISGSTNAADGRTMNVTISTQTLTASVTGGTWSVNAAHLADGVYNVTAAVTVSDGTPAASAQSLTIDTIDPVVVVPPTVETTDSTPAITGSGAEPGSIVVVSVGGQTMTTTAGPDGTWTVTPPNPLPAGTNIVTVTITDPAGNSGTGTQIITVAESPTTTPPTSGDAQDFTPVGPKRVFDTRAGQSQNSLRIVAKRQVVGGYELSVQMTDLVGYVPSSGVGAVSLNVTSAGSVIDGFITVYACGTRDLVSSVNFPAGRTVANAVIAPVSASGAVCFFANTATDIIVDINGWFAADAAFNAVGPKRLFDTRPDNSPDALRNVPKAKLAADTMMEVRVTDLAGYVPASGVESVSMNVVVSNPEAAGFITVYACGARTLVSTLNFSANQTIANAVVAPVSASGTVCFYSPVATDLIVDINGWLATGSGYHGIDPSRVLDTRPDNSPNAIRNVSKTKIGGSNVLTVQVTDMAGLVPAAGVAAVSLNLTATNTEGVGFVTVFACETMEQVSNLNYDAGTTVANAVLAPVSAAGTICLYSNQLIDAIIDINGWIGTGGHAEDR